MVDGISDSSIHEVAEQDGAEVLAALARVGGTGGRRDDA